MASVEDMQIDRFMKALRTALAMPPERSHRALSAELGITVGSFSKYLRAEVHPYKVGFEVQAKLAKVLGHTIDDLYRYYETGEWESELSLDAVTGWLQSSAGQEDLPLIMQSLAAASQRINGGGAVAFAMTNTPEPAPYTWPIEAIKESGVSEKMLNKLTLTVERLKALAVSGTFDDELVEGFSMACDFEEKAVRDAFTERLPVS